MAWPWSKSPGVCFVILWQSWTPWGAVSFFPHCCCSLVAKLCLTLYHLMDSSLPGSSIHGIFQARILERVAISLSGGSSWPRDQTWVSCLAGRRWAIWEALSPLHFPLISRSGCLNGTSHRITCPTSRPARTRWCSVPVTTGSLCPRSQSSLPMHREADPQAPCLIFQQWEAKEAIVISLSSEGISQCAPRLILWGVLEQGCFRIIPNKEKGIGLYLSVSPITGCGDYSQKRGGDFEEGLSLQPKTIPREALSADLLVINAAEVGGMITQVLMRGEGSRQSTMAAAIKKQAWAWGMSELWLGWFFS